MSQLYAMAPSASTAGAPPPSGPAALLQFAPLVVIFVLFYFILLRPQQKAAKQRKEMVAALRPGDAIVTSSGIYGTVVKVNDDDTLQVKVAENVTLKMARAAVESMAKKG
jgi:preprotein translocase subunit YajC